MACQLPFIDLLPGCQSEAAAASTIVQATTINRVDTTTVQATIFITASATPVLAAPSTSASATTKTSAGVNAAAIVIPIILVLVLGGLTAWICVRRRRKRREAERMAPNEQDGYWAAIFDDQASSASPQMSRKEDLASSKEEMEGGPRWSAYTGVERQSRFPGPLPSPLPTSESSASIPESKNLPPLPLLAGRPPPRVQSQPVQLPLDLPRQSAYWQGGMAEEKHDRDSSDPTYDFANAMLQTAHPSPLPSPKRAAFPAGVQR